EPVVAAAELIHAARGRVIVTCMGKSGHVGRKIAATFASTGTPAFFVHPSEASHGDLGMVTADDVMIALSWSGETAELKDLTDYSRRFRIGLIAITASADSTLAQAACVGARMSEAIAEMTAKTFGCVGIVDHDGRLAGIITDGDLRRHMSANLLELKVEAVMTRDPTTVRPDQLVSEALEQLNTSKKTQ